MNVHTLTVDELQELLADKLAQLDVVPDELASPVDMVPAGMSRVFTRMTSEMHILVIQ